MPIRGNAEREKQTQRFEYSYDEVVDKIKEIIDQRFGGVGKFLDSEIYKKTGLGETKNDKAKIYTYLSNPTEKTKRVRSFPVIQKLFSALENTILQQEKETIIKTKIISLKEL